MIRLFIIFAQSYILKKKRLADFLCQRKVENYLYAHRTDYTPHRLCGRRFLFVRKGFDSLSGG